MQIKRSGKNGGEILDVMFSEITVLSEQEFWDLTKDQRVVSGDTWLRYPGFWCAECRNKEEKYFHPYPNGARQCGVRPVLIVSPQSKSVKIKSKDTFRIANRNWTAVSKNMIVCDAIVGKCSFREDMSSDDLYDYDKSDLKKWLYDWAEKVGIELTGETSRKHSDAFDKIVNDNQFQYYVDSIQNKIAILLQAFETHTSGRGARIEKIKTGDEVSIKYMDQFSEYGPTYDILNKSGETLGVVRTHELYCLTKIDKCTIKRAYVNYVVPKSKMPRRTTSSELFVRIELEVPESLFDTSKSSKSSRMPKLISASDLTLPQTGKLDFDYSNGDAVLIRGPIIEISKLEEYVDSCSKINRNFPYSVKEVSDGIVELSLYHKDCVPSIVEKFPALKITGLYEDFEKSEVIVWYSDPGYPYVTRQDFAGYFDGQQESSSARWLQSRDMMKPVSCSFTHLRTGDRVRVNYKYPYSELWNRSDDYIVEINGNNYEFVYGYDYTDDYGKKESSSKNEKKQLKDENNKSVKSGLKKKETDTDRLPQYNTSEEFSYNLRQKVYGEAYRLYIPDDYDLDDDTSSYDFEASNDFAIIRNSVLMPIQMQDTLAETIEYVNVIYNKLIRPGFETIARSTGADGSDITDISTDRFAGVMGSVNAGVWYFHYPAIATKNGLQQFRIDIKAIFTGMDYEDSIEYVKNLMDKIIVDNDFIDAKDVYDDEEVLGISDYNESLGKPGSTAASKKTSKTSKTQNIKSEEQKKLEAKAKREKEKARELELKQARIQSRVNPNMIELGSKAAKIPKDAKDRFKIIKQDLETSRKRTTAKKKLGKLIEEYPDYYEAVWLNMIDSSNSNTEKGFFYNAKSFTSETIQTLFGCIDKAPLSFSQGKMKSLYVATTKIDESLRPDYLSKLLIYDFNEREDLLGRLLERSNAENKYDVIDSVLSSLKLPEESEKYEQICKEFFIKADSHELRIKGIQHMIDSGLNINPVYSSYYNSIKLIGDKASPELFKAEYDSLNAKDKKKYVELIVDYLLSYHEQYFYAYFDYFRLVPEIKPKTKSLVENTMISSMDSIARSHYNSGSVDAAEASFNAILQINPNDGGALFGLAQCDRYRGNCTNIWDSKWYKEYIVNGNNRNIDFIISKIKNETKVFQENEKELKKSINVQNTLIDQLTKEINTINEEIAATNAKQIQNLPPPSTLAGYLFGLMLFGCGFFISINSLVIGIVLAVVGIGLVIISRIMDSRYIKRNNEYKKQQESEKKNKIENLKKQAEDKSSSIKSAKVALKGYNDQLRQIQNKRAKLVDDLKKKKDAK